MFARLIVHSPQVLMASPAHKQHGNQELTHGRDRPVGLKRTQAFFACRVQETLTWTRCARMQTLQITAAGTVAEWKARRKNAEHPVFDAQNHRRLQAFDFRFERHGYWAKETVGN